MADGQEGRQLQQTHASNALTYGHLGTATYNDDTHEWTFLRSNIVTIREPDELSNQGPRNSAFPFRLVEGEIKVVHRSEASENSDDDDGHTVPSHGINDFLSHLPDVVLALPNIDQNQLALSRLNERLPTLDPNISERLAFGLAARLPERGKHSGHAFVPIAAFVAGAYGESVKFVRIGREQVRVWDLDITKTPVHIPCITDRDEAWWTGNGEQIQQISFSTSSERLAAWMAVRQRSCTTLLHPLIHRQRVPPRHAPEDQRYSHRPASLLDANPALTLPCSRTGGFAHADVAFNPHDSRTLAIIDEQGNWSIWKIEGKRAITSRVLFRMRLQLSGKLHSWQEQRPPLNVSPYFDGWHRLCWLGTSTHIIDRLLLCNRRSVAVYDMAGNVLGNVNVRLGSIRDGQRILDVKKSSANQGHCFILTSSRLLMMSAADEDWTDPNREEPLGLICSWQHFRDRADLTLRIALAETPQSTTIFLFSKQVSFITAFRVGLELETSSLPVSLAGPVQFVLPQYDEYWRPQNTYSDLHFRDLESRRLLFGHGNDFHPLTLMKLFIQDVSFKVAEVLYQCIDPRIMTTVGIPHSLGIKFPVDRARPTQSAKYADMDEIYDFVVEDTQQSEFEHSKIQIQHSHQPRPAADQSPHFKKNLMSDLRDIYELAVAPDDLLAFREREDFVQSLLSIHRDVKAFVKSNKPLSLLSDLIEVTAYIADIEEDSEAFTAFLNTIKSEIRFTNLQMPHQNGRHEETILDIHSSMLEAWISPLSTQIPDRIRVAKERQSRVIAADLALSRIGIRRPLQEAQISQDERTQPHTAEPLLPLCPSSVPRQAPPSSGQGAPQSVSTQEEPSFIRLRNLTSLKKAFQLASTSSAITDILAHVPADISVHPSTYNWRATELNVADQHNQDAVLKLDPKARQSVEKRVEMQRRRLEAQKKISQAVEAERALPTVLGTQFSSPMLTRQVQSSQIGAPGSSQTDAARAPTLAMTQPETGMFGSRATGMRTAGRRGNKSKPKKPQRVAGF